MSLEAAAQFILIVSILSVFQLVIVILELGRVRRDVEQLRVEVGHAHQLIARVSGPPRPPAG